MAELPEGITQKELDEYAKLDRGIKKLQIRHKILNEKIKTTFTKVGTFVFGSVIVKRTEADSFDAKAAEKAFPLDKHPEFYKSVFDASALPADKRKKFTTKVQRLSVDVAAE